MEGVFVYDTIRRKNTEPIVCGSAAMTTLSGALNIY